MKVGRMKRWIFSGLGVVLATFVTAYAWSYWPITADVNATDPAVALANKIGKEGIEYSEGFIESEGRQIHYVSAGEGDTIVFLHGFPSYWFTMFGLMDEFKSDFRVVAIDGLGVGKSDAPSSVDAYKIEKLVGHVEDVIEEQNLGSVHLVGHDWGAALATAYAQAYPSKTKTLTAIGALPHNILLTRIEDDPKYQEIFSYMDTFKSANPVLIRVLGMKNQIWEDTYKPFVDNGWISSEYGERLRQDVGDPRRTDRFISWYRANFPDFEEIDDSFYWPGKDARVKVPALFIYGKDDRVVTPELAQDFKKLSDSMQVLPLEKTGHRPHFEKKEVVVSAIRKLIEQERE